MLEQNDYYYSAMARREATTDEFDGLWWLIAKDYGEEDGAPYVKFLFTRPSIRQRRYPNEELEVKSKLPNDSDLMLSSITEESLAYFDGIKWHKCKQDEGRGWIGRLLNKPNPGSIWIDDPAT